VIAVIRSEWTKLRRPGMLIGGLSSMVLVAVLGSVLGVAAAGAGNDTGPRAGDALSLAQLHSSAGLARALGQSTMLLGVVALCIGGAALASEYSTGTLRNLLVREPRRLRLLGGMAVGVLSFIAAATVLALLVASGAALAIASTKGIDTSAWLAPAGLGHLGRTSIDLIASTLGFGLIGILLGVLLRSPVAAIGVGVAYALPVEAILSSTVNGIDRYLPGQLLGVLADGGTHAISYTSAWLTVGLYATVAVVGVGALFWRRDVAA
jgi:ABC-2 type transport system permease protein